MLRWLPGRVPARAWSERRSSPAQEGGSLVHGRWKVVTPQCFYLDQHRSENALRARDKRRRAGVPALPGGSL